MATMGCLHDGVALVSTQCVARPLVGAVGASMSCNVRRSVGASMPSCRSVGVVLASMSWCIARHRLGAVLASMLCTVRNLAEDGLVSTTRTKAAEGIAPGTET